MTRRLLPLVAVALALSSIGPAQSIFAHSSQSAKPAAAAPGAITVLVGLGQVNTSPGSLLSFTPKYADISVGDTVTFKQIDQLEPHTVTFASPKVLESMTNTFISPVMQKNGPPIFTVNAKWTVPTPSKTYDGVGVANSGLFAPGSNKSWSLTFTKPGTYKYICLIHGTGMTGTVVVHPIQSGHMWIVQAGDGQAAASDKANITTNDSFYPRHITVHVGDTVMWIGGFHTVSFGPETMLRQLEQNLFVPLMQPGKPMTLQFNPKIANPQGGPSYDGTGFVSSGILPFQVPPGSTAPPSYKLKFTKAGMFSYDCLIHPGMDGTVNVVQ